MAHWLPDFLYSFSALLNFLSFLCKTFSVYDCDLIQIFLINISSNIPVHTNSHEPAFW